MQKKSVLGFDIHYRKIGEGKPIVLLHGYGGSHTDWEDSGHLLARSHTVYLPNFSHHYLSPAKKLDFSHLVDLVAAFIQSIKVSDEPVLLAGTSFGAAISWGVAIEYPNLVERLVLVAPMPPNPIMRLRDPLLRGLLLLARIPKASGLFLTSPIGRLFIPYLENIFQFPWGRAQSLRRALKASSRMIKMISHSVERFDWIIRHEDWGYWESRLYQIDVPILILAGSSDPLFSKDEPQRFFKLFQRAELRVIENGGHAMSREKHIAISEMIENFHVNRNENFKNAVGQNPR